MAAVAALLRAVNVGGHGKVPMDRLREVCEGLGHREVATYLQSGNVVFRPAVHEPAAIVAGLEAALAAAFGARIDVILRTGVELRAVLDGSPFRDEAAADPAKLLVLFLRDTPPADAMDRLAARHKGPERFALVGRDLHIHFPDGMGRSKLSTPVIEKTVGLGTGRNWNTVTALARMTAERA